MMAGRNIFACWLRHRKSSTLIRKYRRVNLKLPLLPCLDLGFILWLQLNFCLGAICQFGRCFVSPAASRFDCHMRATAFRETFCLKLLPQMDVLNTLVTLKVVAYQTGKPFQTEKSFNLPSAVVSLHRNCILWKGSVAYVCFCSRATFLDVLKFKLYIFKI
jgi:hypothetical protein